MPRVQIVNYYSRYPSHYLAATVELTMEQDGAYTRLLDWYYSRECAIPDNKRYVIGRATVRKERAAIDYVLSTFFDHDVELGVWRQERVELEISKAAPKIEAARENGKRGGRPPKNKPTGFPENNPLGFSNETHEEPSAKAPQSPREEQKQKKEREKTTAVEIDTWMGSLDGEDAIPGDDSIFGWAEKTGIPLDFLALSWITFRDDMRERHKRQRDWRAHYRNAVKRNWYKLWWFDATGACQLTTTGEQARRAAA